MLALLAGCGPLNVACGTHVNGCMLMDPDGTRLRVRGPLHEPFLLPAGGSLALALQVEPAIGDDLAVERRIAVDAPWPLQVRSFFPYVRGRGGIDLVLRAPEDALERMGADPGGVIVPITATAWDGRRQVGGVVFHVRVLPPP